MLAAGLFTAPYDSGHHSARMGRGPGALVAAGAAARLGAAGKPKQAALVVAAHKLVTILEPMIRTDTAWTPGTAAPT